MPALANGGIASSGYSVVRSLRKRKVRGFGTSGFHRSGFGVIPSPVWNDPLSPVIEPHRLSRFPLA